MDGRHYFMRQNITNGWRLTDVDCEMVLINPTFSSKGPKSQRILLSGVGSLELGRRASLVSESSELKMRQHEH